MKDYSDDIYNEAKDLSYGEQRELLKHMRNKHCEFNYKDGGTEMSMNPIELLVDCLVDCIKVLANMIIK